MRRKKITSAPARLRRAARLSFDRGSRVEHYLFEDCEVLKIALSTLCGDSTKCLRAIECVALRYFDKPRCLQHFQMSAQVAVRQSTQLLEGSERQTFSDALRET